MTRPDAGTAATPEVPVVVAARTDVGRHRDNNEDALGEGLAPDGARLLLVADGMGGFEAGELASSEAVRGAVEAWSRSAPGQALTERLVVCMGAANEAVISAATERGLLGQTGTTLVALAVHQGQVAIANIGDSRAYRLRDAQLEQITRDHTESQEMADRGEIPQALVDEHELSHCLTRALGLDYHVHPDLFGPERAQPGDTWLLCSDGLSGPVDDETLRTVLRFVAPSEATGKCIALANHWGGPDNITVQLVRFGADAPLEAAPPDFRLPHELARTRAMLGCSILLALVAAIGVFVVWALR